MGSKPLEQSPDSLAREEVVAAIKRGHLRSVQSEDGELMISLNSFLERYAQYKTNILVLRLLADIGALDKKVDDLINEMRKIEGDNRSIKSAGSAETKVEAPIVSAFSSSPPTPWWRRFLSWRRTLNKRKPRWPRDES